MECKIHFKWYKKINPEFYPNSIDELPSKHNKVSSDWKNVTDGYLSQKEFINVYDKCGKILHAENPLGNGTNYQYYEKNIPNWMDKIKRLLNSHTIKLLNDPNLYLVHMQEDGTDSAKVYTFAPSSKTLNDL